MFTSPLDGPWQFRLHGKPSQSVPDGLNLTRWMPASIPGTVHHQLHVLKKIDDPHYGRNELQQQWIDQQDWEWQRTFHIPAENLATTRQEIIFDGIDTVATIYLNGKEIGRSINMFRQIVCDVRGILRAGANTLCVRIKSPTAFAKAEAEAGGHRVADGDWRWQTGEVRPTYRAWIRKVQCHFGWDWGLYLATSGIWQSCRVECGQGPRISSVKVSQIHQGPEEAPRSVIVQASVELASSVALRGTLVVRCGGQETSISSRLKAGDTSVNAQITLQTPALWWPAGEGAQTLHDLEIEWRDEDGATQSTLTRRIGLRTVELVTKKDRSADGEPAESFYFKVNGRPIFAKGANWIPVDQFVEGCREQKYKHLLNSMVEANMNMVRVWGGGWYEQDIFYDLCDELGLMVWHDFMMACALHPDTARFIGELQQEARYQIGRLHSHPSIMLWCGDNENAEAVWGWWKNSPDLKKHIAIYKKVMSALRKTVETEDPTRRFWLSSPSNNDFNGNNNDNHRGDVHYWTVWHGKQPFSNYLTVKPRFASEFGFQSFPEPRTLRDVVPPHELNPSSRVMEHHQRSPDGNMLITNTMAREMRIPDGFESFCWASQINQAMAIKTAVEHWRRLRPWCMGTLFWQINDLWPVASWSSIDFHGRWKALHHFAARFYSPLLASITVEENGITAWATNDLSRSLSLKGEIEVFTWSGRRIARLPLAAALKAGESRAIATFTLSRILKKKAEPHEVCIFIRLADKLVTHENFATLVPWKWASLPKPQMRIKLSHSGKSLQLHVASPQVVPFFHAAIGEIEGHFTDDWNILRPGRELRMIWRPHDDDSPEIHLVQARELLHTLSLFDMGYCSGTNGKSSRNSNSRAPNH
jgi:beta-mannosidase